MTDTYTNPLAQDKRYTSESADITFNGKRCIHAAECVNRLSEVFDVKKRPWIQPEHASGEAIAEVVSRCPSGALHFERKDGGAAEATPQTNTINLWKDGPLQLRGDLTIQAAGVDLKDTRATLCRCGASEQKPFCDNAHKTIGFTTEETSTQAHALETKGGELTITAHPNGPLEVVGDFEIYDADNNLVFAGDKTWLCRCGASDKKPFCSGAHKTIGFTAE